LFLGKEKLLDGVKPPTISGIKVSSSDLLTREGMKRLLEACPTARGRAFIIMLYESGARIGEILNIEIRDLCFDRHGVLVDLEGKTGKRRIRLVESADYLRRWLKEIDNKFLWPGPDGNEPSKYPATAKFFKKTARVAGLRKKVYPHLFRHSRASELAQKLKESQLRAFMGWGAASDMPRVYIHLSAQDVDKAILDIYKTEESKPKTELNEIKEDFEVRFELWPRKETLKDMIKGFDGLVVRSGVVIDKDIIDSSKNLKVIARAGVGLDNIDLRAAKEKGIIVFNVPRVSAEDVAELTFGLILAVSRKISLADRQLRKNLWKKDKLMGYRIRDKTLGIVGCGKIGSAIAHIGIAFGMGVIASVENYSKDREVEFKERGIALRSNKDVVENSDYLVIATPLTISTENLITLEKMKCMGKNAFLINVSRGNVVNESDLLYALKKGIIRGAATDVFSEERKKTPLFKLDNMVFTPHIGAMTDEAQYEIGKETINKFNHYLYGKKYVE
jgi:D-3-phosphoglycerate dehydrogenase